MVTHAWCQRLANFRMDLVVHVACDVVLSGMHAGGYEPVAPTIIAPDSIYLFDDSEIFC